jgi:cell division transport system permease protein
MRLGFFLREAVRAVRRSPAPSFAALATVLVTMLVLGAFIPIVQATNGAANTVRHRVQVNVYMKTTATKPDEARVRKEIAAIPHVKTIRFVSKQTAFKQQAKADPAAYKLLGANPLPDTFQIVPTDPKYVLAVHNALTGGGAGSSGATGTPLDAAIHNISNKTTDTKKILQVTNLVTITAAVLTALLTIASILLIANTIRLSLYSRRREVEVMKLVGATDWFIRWPFMIEGVIVGAAGAVLALVVLGVAKVVLLDPLASNWIVGSPRTIPFVALVAVLLAAGVGVSALGSGLSLRRFLRV